MGRLKKKNMEKIQVIFEEKTGVNVTKNKRNTYYVGAKNVVMVGALLCFVTLSAFVYSKFTGNVIIDEKPKETVRVDMVENSNEEEIRDVSVYSITSKFEDWTWPTVSKTISSTFGMQRNGTNSDHINIAGEKGDEIYAVAAGSVTETGYVSTYGNYVVIDLGNGITVKYGHLKDVFVEQGVDVEQGQKIATLGATGMATGPNLSFAVYINGEAVNPLAE